MRTSRMTVVVLALAFCAATGCPDLSKYNTNYGKVHLVKPGMSYADILNKIGKPLRVIRGKGLRINWQELVYERGSIFLYRLRVQKVIERAEGAPLPEEDPEDMLKPWEERNIFEEETSAQSNGKRPARR